MNTLQCEDIQRLGVGILECFDKYAREHSLTYYMAGGTLLGAVRHKGFIPWDDDIDLMMPREDYEKLIRSFKDDRYIISSCETDDTYTTPFARIWDTQTELEFTGDKNRRIGVFADIFPIDGYPSKDRAAKFRAHKLKYLRAKINSANRLVFKEKEKFIPLKKLLKYIWFHDGNYYSRKLNAFAKRMKVSECEYCGVTTTTEHIYKERNPKSNYEETVYLEFEGLKLPAPSGYEDYLKRLYGDYMKLPPEEERKTEHLFIVSKKGDNISW